MGNEHGRVKLARWKERHKLTDKALAEKFAIHASMISKLIIGERTPGLQLAFTIWRVTKIPVASWLVGDARTP